MLFFSINESKNTANAINEIIRAGCANDLIQQVIQQRVIQDYEPLCQAYLRQLPDMRKELLMPWMLFCLSGEKNAFNIVKTFYETQKNQIIEKNIARVNSQRAHSKSYHPQDENILRIDEFSLEQFGEKIFYLCVASGNPDQVDRALALKLNIDGIKKSINVIFYAALTGNVAQLKKILDIEKEFNITFPRTDKKGRNVLHAAAIYGDATIIQLAATLVEKDVKDAYEFNALDYAIVANNEEAIAVLEEMGLKKSETLSDFYFAGLELPNSPGLSNVI